MVSELRKLYKKAVSNFFETVKSEASSLEFINFFQEAENSIHILINSAPDIAVLNEILQDAYALSEKATLASSSVQKKLKGIKDKYEVKINKTVNKSLILSEKKRLEKSATAENLVCPDCNELISRDAEFCPYCGTELAKCIICSSVIGGNQELIVCPNCGESAHSHCLAKSNGKCTKCGTSLNV